VDKVLEDPDMIMITFYLDLEPLFLKFCELNKKHNLLNKQ
jgi:hypothetical protein